MNQFSSIIPRWDDVLQREPKDSEFGGPNSPINQQINSLLNRVEYLKATTNILVLSAVTTQPSGSETPGQSYIVPTGGAGDFAGQDGNLAVLRNNKQWAFLTPVQGWQASIAGTTTQLAFNGEAWVTAGGGGGGGGAGNLLPIGYWDMTQAFSPVTLNTAIGFTTGGAAPTYTLTPDADTMVGVGPFYAAMADSTANSFDGNIQQMRLTAPDVSTGNVVAILMGVCNSGATEGDIINSALGGITGSVSVLAIAFHSGTDEYIESFGPGGPNFQTVDLTANTGDAIYVGVHTTTGEISVAANSAAWTDSGIAVELSGLGEGQTLKTFFMGLFSSTPAELTGGSLTVQFSSSDNDREGFGGLGAVTLPEDADNGKRYLVTAGGNYAGVTTLVGDVVEFRNYPSSPALVVTRLIDPSTFPSTSQMNTAIAAAVATETSRAITAETALGTSITTAVAAETSRASFVEQNVRNELRGIVCSVYAAVNADGRYGNHIYVINPGLTTKRKLNTKRAQAGSNLAISPNRRYLAYLDNGGSINIYDAFTGLTQLAGGVTPLSAPIWNADSTRFAMVVTGSAIAVFELSSGNWQVAHTLNVASGLDYVIKWHPTNRDIIFSLTTTQLIEATVSTGATQVYSVGANFSCVFEITPDGQYFIYTNNNGSPQLSYINFNTLTGGTIDVGNPPSSIRACPALTSTSTPPFMIACAEGSSIEVFDGTNRVANLTDTSGDMCWSPDGQYLLSGEGTVYDSDTWSTVSVPLLGNGYSTWG